MHLTRVENSDTKRASLFGTPGTINTNIQYTKKTCSDEIYFYGFAVNIKADRKATDISVMRMMRNLFWIDTEEMRHIISPNIFQHRRQAAVTAAEQ